MFDRKAYMKEYREKNKEKMKEYRRRYREKNKEKIKERHKKYYENNKDAVKEYNRKWVQDNRSYVKAYFKKYCQKNKEIMIKRATEWNYQHWEKHLMNAKKSRDKKKTLMEAAKCQTQEA